MKKASRQIRKLNNSGATLVTVLVGVGFLLILASILLSVSAASLNMKQIEQTMKTNFYADEQILDDVYNGLGKETTDCLSEAYAGVLSQVTGTDGGAVFTTQDAAYRAFSKRFMEKLVARMPVCGSTDGDTTDYHNLLNRLNSYVTKDAVMAEVVSFNRTEILGEDDAVITTDEIDFQGKLPCKYVFRDVEVRYKLVNGAADIGYIQTGYESVITTDIEIEIPYINFFRDSSILLDYALIGNEGIYFEGTTGAGGRTIEGNVYAGTGNESKNERTFRDEAVHGGLNFFNCEVKFDSHYVISKGDVNVRKAEVTFGGAASSTDPALWAESIRLVEDANKDAEVENPKLTVNGNMYIANDLELNARESEVTLSGNYYGYSNGSFGHGEQLENQEQQNLKDSYQDGKAEHAQSSAIIINGNHSKLDLSGLDTLVVAGVAYVDLQSQAYTGENISNIGGNALGKIEEIATGESLALRSNQYMYLAPTSCLTTSNPVKASEAPDEDEVWKSGYTWFGISKEYVDNTDPVLAKQVTNRTTGEVYTYYYLKFKPDQREKYANLVLNMIDPINDLSDMDPTIYTKLEYAQFDTIELAQIWEAKQSILSRTLNDGVRPAITFADDTTAAIYTKGAIAKVGDELLAGQLPAQESALSVDYVTKMGHILVKHYQYLYTELDPKKEFPLAPATEAEADYADPLPPVTDVKEGSPISKYVDVTGMVNGSESPNYKCGYKTYVYNGDFTLNDNDFKGIILCEGDVTIKSGCDVEGLVVATGKIYVEGSGSIKANRSIVQAILDEEATEEAKKASSTERNMKYASSYLKEFRRADTDYTGKDYSDRVSSTNYTDYISYRNWRKGEAN